VQKLIKEFRYHSILNDLDPIAVFIVVKSLVRSNYLLVIGVQGLRSKDIIKVFHRQYP
jgi:hypothetical protein